MRIGHPRHAGTAALLITAALLGACGDSGKKDTGDDGRVVINTDGDDLSGSVTTKDDPVDVQPASAANAAAVVPDFGYTLTLVAEVAPPSLAGEALQATDIAFAGGGFAVVSYNMAGAVQQGGVDVFVLDADKTPTLASRATFDDTDVNAVGAFGGRVYLATATMDESFGTPAVLETLTVDASGVLSLADHVRVGLSSYAATSVASDGARVFATSGNTGGVHAFDPGTDALSGAAELDDARWVAAPGDGTVVVVQGTPGRLAVLSATDLAPLAEHAFDGAQIAESKSTVAVAGGKAFIAAGPGGTIVMDLATGDVIATIPVPTGTPFAQSEVVTNAVSVDGDLVFISNGAAGVYLAKSSAPVAEPYDPTAPPTYQVAGRLVFPGEIASVNHITFHDGALFVATGRGGLKVVRVEEKTDVPTPPAGYPYVSDFDDADARAGWTLDGAWAFAETDGAHVGRGGAFLDANPGDVDQADASADALFTVPLAVPTDGAPALSFWYTAAFLDPADAVEAQIEDPVSGDWQTVARFAQENARATPARRVVPLDAWRGQEVRFRFHASFGPTAGARGFTVDDVAATELTFPTVDYPFATGFETDAERARFSLEGAWGWESAGNAYDGEAALDANPAGAVLDGYDDGQTATMMAWVAIPAEGLPVLDFWYRMDLVHPDDAVVVEAQTAGDAGDAWAPVATFGPKRDHVGWTEEELPLAALAGETVRFRFRFAFAAGGATARRFALDELRVGPMAGPTLAWPYACGFDDAVASGDWVRTGMFYVAPLSGGGAGVVADPTGALAAGGSGEGHELRTLGFVPVPADAPARLTFRAQLKLADTEDRLYVEVQPEADGVWTRLVTFGKNHSRNDWARYELPLDAVAGQSVRIRFRAVYGNAAAERVVNIDDVAVEGLPAARYDYPWAAQLDAAGLASWSVTGAWKVANGYLDGNWLEQSQAGFQTAHQVVMGGFVHIPEDGRPTLVVGVQLDLVDPADAVIVEAQTPDSGAWTRLRAYTSAHDRQTPGWDEISLADYAGDDVRFRVRFAYGQQAGVRKLELLGLRVEELGQGFGDLAYPWGNGFENADAVAEWSLWGVWAGGGAHGAVTPGSGVGFLDGNPRSQAQASVGELQTATLGSDVQLPLTPAWAGFRHHFGAVDAADALYFELQADDSDAWTTLATITKEHAQPGYAPLEASLDAFRGHRVRLRFRMTLGETSTVRELGVDDVWIGPLPTPIYPGPIVSDFGVDHDLLQWDLHGGWGVVAGWLRSNPGGVDQAGFSTYHTATQAIMVDLAEVPTPTLAVRYTLNLTHSADRAFVEVQADGDVAWTTLGELTIADNTATAVERQWPLSGHGAVLRVRFRTTCASAPGVRDFAVQRVGIESAP